MRLESAAVYGCSNYSGNITRTGSFSQSALTGASSPDEQTSAAQTEDAKVFTNADGDTLEISAEAQKASPAQLDSREQQVVAQLKAIDQKVRSHEMAHLVAAGPYARGAPSYSYVKGPNGVNYAVGGEVPIDVSPEPGDPDATIRKAEVVRAAAMAPADPSGQDQRVAAAATQLEAEARQELSEKQAESQTKSSKNETDDADSQSDAQPTADGEDGDEKAPRPFAQDGSQGPLGSSGTASTGGQAAGDAQSPNSPAETSSDGVS
jgi:hypothetical protein